MLRTIIILAPLLSVTTSPVFRKQSFTLTIFPLRLAHNPHISASSAENHLSFFTTPDCCHARLFARLLAPKEIVLAIVSAFSRFETEKCRVRTEGKHGAKSGGTVLPEGP